MKVKDLIAKLEKFDENDTVLFVATTYEDDWGKSYIDFTCDDAEFIERNGKLMIGYDSCPPDNGDPELHHYHDLTLDDIMEDIQYREDNKN